MNMMTKSIEAIKKIWLNLKSIILKNKIVSILIINTLIVVALLLIGAVQFETIDDYMIYELLSGKWGHATNYTVYINIILSSMLMLMFKIVPNVNWYVIMLLTTHILSFTVLGYLISEKFKNGMKLYSLVLIAMYIPLLIFLQYTSQAAMLILSGFLYAFNIIGNRERKYKLIFPSIMILIGSLIRFETLIYIAPFMLLNFIFRIAKKQYNKTELVTKITFTLIVLLVILLLKFIHIQIYNNNLIYKEYSEYNNVRTIIHDYLGDNYNNNIEVYDTVGWSLNDYILMKMYNNADELVFNVDNMKYIIRNVKLKTPTFHDLTKLILNVHLLPYLLILLILAHLSIREGCKKNLIIAVIAICLELIFIVMGKMNIRTCVLNYIIAIIYMASNLKEIKIKNCINFENCVIFISLIIVLSTNITTVKENKNNSMEKAYNKFTEFASNNQQNAYIYSRTFV